MRVEATLVVTADIQTLNYTAIFTQGAAFCVSNNAVDSYQEVAGGTNGVERSLFNGTVAKCCFTVIDIARGLQGIVALNSC